MADSSLRLGLLVRLGLAVIVLLALDALACYFTALYFANRVYDRWLIDSARSLAQAVHANAGRVELDLTKPALDVFRYDEIDKTYFKIATAKRGVIAGDVELPDLEPVATNDVRFADAKLAGEPVRVVATRIMSPVSGDSVTITVGETLRKRSDLARDVLLRMVAPQMALLAIALLFAWASVSRGLKPLTDLASQLEARGRENLMPVADAGLPRETRVLVQRLNELLARLGQAMHAQERFVADAAHQLRTPLAAMLLHTERALRATDVNGERNALRGLHRSVERAARLSQQLLTLARAEPDGSVARRMQPVDLAALARRVGEEWVPRALAREIDFGLKVPAAPVVILGDEALLGEMLSNLVDNALRYGGSPGRVTVIVLADPQPTLAVQDDGPGIPAQERERVFERFYRMQSSEGHGCGLGLAIVQQIARAHDASVAVESGTNERGCKFVVAFPRTQPERGAHTGASARVSHATSSSACHADR